MIEHVERMSDDRLPKICITPQEGSEASDQRKDGKKAKTPKAETN